MGNLLKYAKVCGSKLAPGTKAQLYLAAVCDLDGFPQTVYEATPGDTTPTRFVTLNAAFTMKIGKKFEPFDIVVDSGGASSEKIGDDGTAFENSLEFRIAGDNPTQLAVFEGICSNDVVGVVETTNGDRYVIGTTLRPAKVDTAKFDTGKQLTDAVGTDYVLKATNVWPILHYPAGLALTINI